jgi:hypothetical protein
MAPILEVYPKCRKIKNLKFHEKTPIIQAVTGFI